ncbi:porin [Candidatus Pelagibacter bacterium nBUS_36]|uniref:porin n=1 Tax=Candidatus Pelagibacter bacterium nBUS_36 TaxID=3374194 RepID=UPI003EBD4333
MKKIGLTALAASLVSVSANAVDISGGASLSYNGGNGGATGNPWSMNDNLTFTWGGELDNGMTVDLNFLLDSSDSVAGAGIDNRSLALGLNNGGTLTFWGDGGSGVVGSFDDAMPTAYEESWYSADSPNQGHSPNNMFYYTHAIDAATIHASFSPASGGSDASSLEIGAVITAIEDLTIGVAIGEDNGSATAVDNTILYATYTMGGATIGVQKNEADSATTGDEDFQAAAISYAVSEDMSVSVGKSKLDYEAVGTKAQEATGFSASYTMGSMTLAGTLNKIKNEGAASTGAGNTKKDSSDTFELNLSFAF